MRILLILSLVLISIIQTSSGATIVADQCAPGLCNNALTGPPILKYFYSFIVRSNPRLGLDLGLMNPWATDNGVGIYLESGVTELLRANLLATMQSSIGPDVVAWQAYQVVASALYNLTQIAIDNNWKSIYTKEIIDTVTNSNGDIVAAPVTFMWWGMWYKKSTWAAAGLTMADIPKTFDQLLIVAQKLQQYTGVPAFCLSHGDLWQGLWWWSQIYQRFGGRTAWDDFLSTQRNMETDPINIQTFEFIAKLLPFMQQGPSTIVKTFANALTEWVTQNCSMVAAYGGARAFPALVKINGVPANPDDYSWFRFPDAFPTGSAQALPANETGEISGFSMIMVNSISIMIDKAVSFVKNVSSIDYQRNMVPFLNGDFPANTELQSLITDPEIVRALKMMNTTKNIFNVADAVHPDWAIVAKPMYVQLFTSQVPIDTGPRLMEIVRQQVQLSTTIAPIYSLSGDTLNILTLTSYTTNASIFYSLNDNTAIYTYYGPIELPIGANTLTCFARLAGQTESATKNFLISVGHVLFVGQELENTPIPTYYLAAVCMTIVGNWVALIIIEQAIYFNTKSLGFATLNEKNQASMQTMLWLSLAAIAVSICNWGAISAAITGIYIKDLPTNMQEIRYAWSSSLGAVLPAPVLVFAAFYLMTVSRPMSDKSKRDLISSATSGTMSVGSLGSKEKRAPHSPKISPNDHRPKISAKYDSDQIHLQVQSAEGDQSTDDNILGTNLPSSPKNFVIVGAKPSKYKRYLQYAWDRCDRYLLGASGSIILSVLCNYFVAMLGVNLPCSRENSIGSIIAGIIVAYIFAIIGIFMVFYYRETELRPVGAFFMAGVMASIHFIITDGVTFTYQGKIIYLAANAEGSNMPGSTLFAIAAAIVAATLFFLIAINVRKLKLTRDSTDSALIKTNKEKVKLESKLDDSENLLIYDQWQIMSLRSAYTPDKRKSHFIHPERYQVNDTPINVTDVEDLAGEGKSQILPSRQLVLKNPMSNEVDINNRKFVMPTIEQVLENTITFEYFHRHAVQRRTDENFKFLIDVEIFKQLHSSEQIKEAYDNIVQTYINQKSPMEINIDHNTRVTVLKAAGRLVSVTVFNDCVKIVKTLIAGNEWKIFSEDLEQMKACVNVLHAHQQISSMMEIKPKLLVNNIEKAINLVEFKKKLKSP